MRPIPPCPTTLIPGSPGKLEVMKDRYEHGFQLHHPDDLTDFGAGFDHWMIPLHVDMEVDHCEVQPQ